MDNMFEISLLLDFYGQMLTERQYEILDMHYNSDYSLAEIAEILNISRQGVFDNIKRGKVLLYEFEGKLGLVGKFSRQKARCQELLGYINRLDSRNLSLEDQNILKKIEEGIQEVIEIN